MFCSHRTLGNWLDTSIKTQQWTTLIDPALAYVYVKLNNRWIKYNVRGHSQLHLHSITRPPPSHLLPVSIKEPGQRFYHLVFARHNIFTLPQASPPSTFLQFIKSLPTYEQTLIGQVVRLRSWELKNVVDMLYSGSFLLAWMDQLQVVLRATPSCHIATTSRKSTQLPTHYFQQTPLSLLKVMVIYR